MLHIPLYSLPRSASLKIATSSLIVLSFLSVIARSENVSLLSPSVNCNAEDKRCRRKDKKVKLRLLN
jgi:hypothetical protein